MGIPILCLKKTPLLNFTNNKARDIEEEPFLCDNWY